MTHLIILTHKYYIALLKERIEIKYVLLVARFLIQGTNITRVSDILLSIRVNDVKNNYTMQVTKGFFKFYVSWSLFLFDYHQSCYVYSHVDPIKVEWLSIIIKLATSEYVIF